MVIDRGQVVRIFGRLSICLAYLLHKFCCGTQYFSSYFWQVMKWLAFEMHSPDV